MAARIADLEGGVGALLTASGQAANLFACLNICSAGDHIVSAGNIYGGGSGGDSSTAKERGAGGGGSSYVNTTRLTEVSKTAGAWEGDGKASFTYIMQE